MCIEGIHDIVSHILEGNPNLTSKQVRDEIIKLNSDLINDKIFMVVYPNIYGIVFCEIKLGLHEPRLKLNKPRLELDKPRLVVGVNNYYDDYDFDMSSINEIIFHDATNQFLQLEKNIDNFCSHLTSQEENKKSEYHKKCQNRIIQKMTNQRMVTKQKQRITKFRKY
ncbi:hypothetical protein ma846 [Moumouvirus australiensis]|uniref:Uncharacterized protein n=1 Tax=Moumouvirus australiensis TaxID=2109587 RepID=A0A2P1EMX4_9VIRU|nr:hypothetical protein QKC55_gp058 [Moumouvirus australiensis]AVL95233.1 hypothetical protein ma846 [Moumouvirus australiensis]